MIADEYKNRRRVTDPETVVRLRISLLTLRVGRGQGIFQHALLLGFDRGVLLVLL
jgi:hypothetical protein